MATEVTISLPDEVYQRAERFALLANRDLGSVLADTVGGFAVFDSATFGSSHADRRNG
jgi:hypothetical protein